MMNTSGASVTTAFLHFSREKLDQFWPRLRSCVESLSDEQVWWRPDAVSNSIGNLILHLNGNVRQWLVSFFRRSEDLRNRRRTEFLERRLIPRSALLEKLGTTLEEASEVLASLREADLLTTLIIQGYTLSGLHYGQLVRNTLQRHSNR